MGDSVVVLTESMSVVKAPWVGFETNVGSVQYKIGFEVEYPSGLAHDDLIVSNLVEYVDNLMRDGQKSVRTSRCQRWFGVASIRQGGAES